MTIFTVTDTATPGAQSQQYEKPLEAYRKAAECEAGGRSAVIKLPNATRYRQRNLRGCIC